MRTKGEKRGMEEGTAETVCWGMNKYGGINKQINRHMFNWGGRSDHSMDQCGDQINPSNPIHLLPSSPLHYCPCHPFPAFPSSSNSADCRHSPNSFSILRADTGITRLNTFFAVLLTCRSNIPSLWPFSFSRLATM